MITIGKDPISEEYPQGVDSRYEPAFEELQAEIDKLGSPTASGGIDWQRVSRLAEQILSEESKDLLVCSYFAVSRIYIDGLSGLETGLAVYRDLLQTYWDTMFPKKKRMRGRAAAAEWWVEKSAAALEFLGLQFDSLENQEAVSAECETLKQLCNELFPDPPDFGVLTRAVSALPVTAGAEPAPASVAEEAKVPENVSEETVSSPEPELVQQPAAPVAAPASQPAPAAVPRPSVQQTAAGDSPIGLIQTSNENLKRAALGLLGEDLSNHLGHRSLRTAVWGAIDSLPQATDGKTIIPPPEPHIMTAMQDLSSRGDWLNLATAAGSHFPQYIFWLDLQRYCAIGLENLGQPYARAYETVCAETAHFLQRMPGLTELQFADGFSFADEETRDWCQSLGGGGSMDLGTGAVSVQGDTEEAARLSGVMEQAGELLKSKKLIDAVQLVQEGLLTAHSAKDSMQWRLGLVRILLGGKKADIALSHCEKLAEDLKRYDIECWDPQQALVVYTTTYHCVKAVSSKMLKERGGELLDKIARLDSSEAMRIVG